MTTRLSEPLSQEVSGNGTHRGTANVGPGVLLRRLNWTNGDGECRVLGVTSCYRREGVSTVAVQLAMEAASCDDCRVLLVDANLAHPSLHRRFRLSRTPGLAECLTAPKPVEPCIHALHEVPYEVLTSGSGRIGSYNSTRLSRLARALREKFDLVLFDMQAVVKSGAALQMASVLDGAVLVVESERVRAEVGKHVVSQLTLADVPVLGAVLNRRRERMPK